MRWLIDSSIRFKGLVLAAGAGLLVFGFAQAGRLPADALPEFQATVVEVQTEALGLSAEEVEQFVTVPLEQDLLNGIAFLQDIESRSIPGLSSIVLTFEPGTPLLDARQVVAERLAQAVGVAGLPNVANPPQMLQPLSSTNRVAIVRLSPRELTPIQASVLARWVIGPRLLGVAGVANVSIFGQRERQVQVLVDPERLEEAGVSISQVIRTTGNALEVSPLTFLEASKPGTGGFIDTQNQRFQVFHEQSIKTATELAQVPLTDETGAALVEDGRPITLGEVTDIVEDHQPLIGDALCSDGACQLLVVEKFPEANTVEVADGIEAALTAMRPGLEGLDVDTSIFRPADYVASAVSGLGSALVIGIVLAILGMAAFLLQWRRLFVAVVGLVVSVAAAVAVLAARGHTINLMILSGLAIGLLVVIDDVVIDATGLSRALRLVEGPEKARDRRIRASLAGLRSAVPYAALAAAAAVVPVLFMTGIPGAFLPPVLEAYLLVVAVSLVVAVTVTPAVAAAVLDGGEAPKVVRRIHRFYDERVARFVDRPRLAVGTLAVLVGLGAISLLGISVALEPNLLERDIGIELDAPPGTSLTRMTEMTDELVGQVAAVPGVRTVGAHIGRAITSDQVANVNEAEIWVNLDATAPYDRTVEQIEEIARQASSLATLVTTHTGQRIEDLLGNRSDDIVVRVYGENPDILADKAEEIRQLVARVDGITGLTIDSPPQEQAVRISTDLDAALAVGLKPGDIRRQSAVLLNGITVGNLFDDLKVFDVVVWGSPQLRSDSSAIKDLLIETDNFGPVRLGSVASVEVVASPAEIRHESVFTYLDVTAGVAGRSVRDVAQEVDAAVASVAFPLEHHAELLGDFDQRRSQLMLMTSLWLAAAVFVFLLLQAGLNSWRLAAVVLPMLTMATAGGLLAIWVTGGELGLGSAAGLFVVFGLAVRLTMVTIRQYQHLHRDEGIPFGRELVIRGTRERLVPMLTTLAAGLAFLIPFAIRGRSAGFEIIQPMAVTAMGGLVSAVLMALLVVPSVYTRFADGEDASLWGQELFDVELAEVEPEVQA